jgi:hypothetical protein
LNYQQNQQATASTSQPQTQPSQQVGMKA